MGMFDEIRWDAALAVGQANDDRIFQTKSLERCWDHYVVSPEGRLLLVGNGWEDEEDLSEATDISRAIDVDFHGDLRLLSVKSHRHYLARFTHGALEWVRPVADGDPWTKVAAAQMKRRSKVQAQADPREEPHGA